MANRINKRVGILVDKGFFDKVFEPERIRLQNKFGVKNFSQREFTSYVAKSGAKFAYPEMKKTFAPRKKRGGQFGLF